jgi:hypothetical protein
MPFTPAPGVADRGAWRSILIVVLCCLPAFASRSLIQDMFFILTMLVLAQFWNLLAGYGGLVSVGQQAFVGIGAYAMFGVVILAGMDPIPPSCWAGRGGPDCSPSRRPSSPSACRAPISPSAPGSSPRWCACDGAGRPSAAARARRCRARRPANVGDGNHRKPLRRTQRRRARHPLLLAGVSLAVAPSRHLLAAAHQARPGPGGRARQHRSGEIRRRRCRPHEMDRVPGHRPSAPGSPAR